MQEDAAGSRLDTFEGVMEEMDRRLVELKKGAAAAALWEPKMAAGATDAPDAKAGTGTADAKAGTGMTDALDVEEEELLAHLLASGGELPASLQAGDGRAGQIADFLASYQAQATAASGSGPVETLMRRFGLGSLPPDSYDHATDEN
jgi:hypothetical protein